MARTRTWMNYIPDPVTGTGADATIGVHGEWLYAVVNVADNSTTVYDGPAILHGVYVNTALSAHALPIKDGSTTVVTLPASAGAGTLYHPFDIQFATSLIVDPDDSATGNVTVAYRPL